ncbi:MAG TPA: imidazole glycerol phosphate synthase subunit HisH [bacterium]
MIAIVDYGVGNLRSLENAFEHLQIDVKRIGSPEEIYRAEKLVLPGVGAFYFAMKNLRDLDLETALLERIRSGIPILGICLGMQIFFTGSEEGQATPGLNIITGEVKRFSGHLKVPQIGWNEVVSHRDSCILKNLPLSRHAYFVHSYFCDPADPNFAIATAEYGQPFTAIVEKDNVFGVQFHPEKSQELGLQILKNFAEL